MSEATKKLMEEAKEELRVEFKKEAKVRIKEKLTQIHKAEQVLANLRRELEELEMELSDKYGDI